MQLAELVAYLDDLLQPWRFKDYAPNGLQVEGRREVARVLCGVTASQALIDQAVAYGADAILVHHGYFWKGEDSRVIGMKKRRLQTLLQNDISLLAYHLPLDAHPVFGNNARLAEVLGLTVDGQCGEQDLLWHGRLSGPSSAADWCARITRVLERPALLLGDAGKVISRVAWCSGGAQDYFEQAIALGVDAFLTGEVSERNQHMAVECDCVFIAAGHHATERFGIESLGRRMQHDLGIETNFIDLKNPV